MSMPLIFKLVVANLTNSSKMFKERINSYSSTSLALGLEKWLKELIDC